MVYLRIENLTINNLSNQDKYFSKILKAKEVSIRMWSFLYIYNARTLYIILYTNNATCMFVVDIFCAIQIMHMCSFMNTRYSFWPKVKTMIHLQRNIHIGHSFNLCANFACEKLALKADIFLLRNLESSILVSREH